MRMFILGLTGPTGAGKSLVSQNLENLGFSVVDADRAAKHAVMPGTICLEELKAHFGAEIILPDGRLDRKKLGRLVFSNSHQLVKLNAITHPHIIALIESELKELKGSGCKKAVLDAPALFESGAQNLCDRVAAVVAPKALRIERIKLRDGLSETEAASRVDAQPPLEYYKNLSDFVIENTGDADKLIIEVQALVAKIGLF